MRNRALYAALVLSTLTALGCERSPRGWPRGVEEVRYFCAGDSTMQPCLFYAPGTDDPRPLLVALHTWSGNHLEPSGAPYARRCIEKGWVFVFPEFRGPNERPEATGSDLAIGDIIGVVEYAARRAPVDSTRVYLVGVSGGGYTALLAAGRSPGLWAGVSVWASISDLSRWYEECLKSGRPFANDIAASCGGPPGETAEIDREYARRSPLTRLADAAEVPLDINAGIRDGHDGSVPVGHSIRAFNAVARPGERVSEENLQRLETLARVPDDLARPFDDPSYGVRKPLFRRQSGSARLTIFDGGHEIVFDAAFEWLSRQKKQPR